MGNAGRPRRNSGRFGQSMDLSSSGKTAQRPNPHHPKRNRNQGSAETHEQDRKPSRLRNRSENRTSDTSSRPLPSKPRRTSSARRTHREDAVQPDVLRERPARAHRQKTRVPHEGTHPASQRQRFGKGPIGHKAELNAENRHGRSSSAGTRNRSGRPDGKQAPKRQHSSRKGRDIYVGSSLSRNASRSAPKSGNARRGPAIAITPKAALVLFAVAAVAVLILTVFLHFRAADIESRRPTEHLASADAMPTKLISSSFSLINAFNALDEATEAFADAGSSVGYFVQTVTGTPILSYNADKKFYSASSIKGPYVLSVFSSGVDDVSNSTKTLVEEAIIQSSNEAYYAVKDEYGVSAINSWLAESNASEAIGRSAYSFLDITPRELAALWQHAWEYVNTPSDTQEWLQTTFSDPKNSVIAELPDAQTWSKPGWIMDDSYSCTVDAGIVERDGCAYIVSVMTDKGYDFSLVDDMVKAIDTYILAMPDSMIAVDVSTSVTGSSEDGYILVEDAADDVDSSSQTKIAVSESDASYVEYAQEESSSSAEQSGNDGPTYKLTVRGKD